jgi:acyl-CoA reductase-like NAD-dependent aldehyde dehydrogenase
MSLAIRAWRIRPEAVALCWKARQALIEHALDWEARPFVERQRMLREFRVRAGKPVDEWLEILGRLERDLIAGPGGYVEPAPLDRLAAFYDHLGDLDCAPAIESAWRDPELRSVDCRAAVVRRLADLLEPASEVVAR